MTTLRKMTCQKRTPLEKTILKWNNLKTDTSGKEHQKHDNAEKEELSNDYYEKEQLF